MGVKGYKVFNPDWTCRDFKYEVGQTYTHDGPIAICKAGFHFCQKPSECFDYYRFDSSNHVAEIEAIGNVIITDGKSVTNKITIIREIPWHEVLDLVNEGKNCTGLGNTGNFNTGDENKGNWNTGDKNAGYWNTGDDNAGDRNTGDRNTGNFNTGWCNSGYRNTGDYNTGVCNSGDGNTGNFNTGDRNTGHRNTGCWNTGNWNTGCWNTIDYSSGFFNTIDQPITAFNRPLKMSRIEFLNTRGMRLLNQKFNLTIWISSRNMSDTEKKEHPEHKTHAGYFKALDLKTACRQMWDDFTDGERQAVREIPNFDPDVFEEITGIDARK